MSNTTSRQMNLWKQHKESKNSETREKLILEYAPLVKYVAGRLSIYLGSHVEYDDLVSYGIFGLIDAIDKFDMSKGVKFETYASLRIRGAIIDSIRQLDWVPRTLRQKNKEVEKAFVHLESKLGRPPQENEVADYLGVSIDELYKLLNDINVSHIISLDEFLEQNYEANVDACGDNQFQSPAEHVESSELKELMTNAIDTLSEKEKMVVTLYYFEELTLKEISAIMKVSESRISQIHSKAITRLRSKMNRHSAVLYE